MLKSYEMSAEHDLQKLNQYHSQWYKLKNNSPIIQHLNIQLLKDLIWKSKQSPSKIFKRWLKFNNDKINKKFEERWVYLLSRMLSYPEFQPVLNFYQKYESLNNYSEIDYGDYDYDDFGHQDVRRRRKRRYEPVPVEEFSRIIHRIRRRRDTSDTLTLPSNFSAFKYHTRWGVRSKFQLYTSVKRLMLYFLSAN